MSNHKETNRLMWMVKGCLVPDGYSEKDYISTYDNYFKRVWYNNESCDEGFEEAYMEKYG
tara:strand:- start:9 stop:188 length:180 start_codon:yes stop_codon:yes gene_type:complete